MVHPVSMRVGESKKNGRICQNSVCVRVRTIRNSEFGHVYTHARRFFGSPTFFHFTETLRTIGRVSTHPAHSTQCLRATGRAGQCPAPTKPSLLNQRNMYVDHVKRSRQKSSERKQKTPTGRGGTLGRPPLWRKDGYRYPHMKKVLKLLSR